MSTAPLPSTRPAWKALQAHYQTIRDLHLRTLFADDPKRGERLTAEACGLYLDYSKHRVTDETLKLLFALAEEASADARRGDYADAVRKLDEAERMAPRYALVHQYRSNVAYLMGDRAAAISALKKGLALEPDNALFRNNLESIEKTAAR